MRNPFLLAIANALSIQEAHRNEPGLLPNGKNLAQFFAGILKFEFLPRPGDAHGGHLRANLVGRRIFILKRLIQRGNLGARGRSEASTTLSTGTTRSQPRTTE